MAHDFKIKHKNNIDKAWFFGFANGLLYTTFNAIDCYAVFSGNGETIERSYDEVYAGLVHIINEIRSWYPDKSRADELAIFLEKMENHPHDSVYELTFC